MINMNVILIKAKYIDCPIIAKVQKISFSKLLEKYKDYDTNPACEDLEKIQEKFRQTFTEYYLIKVGKSIVGIVRIVSVDNNTKRISPICILPEYQNKGYAGRAMTNLERMFPQTHIWLLDTIKQESELCDFYEKLGYIRTGREKKLHSNMTIAFFKKEV